MRSRCILPLLALLLHAGAALAAPGHRVESVLRISAVGQAPHDTPSTVLVTDAASRHESPTAVSILRHDAPALQQVLEPKTKTWYELGADGLDAMRGLSSGMVSGFAKRVGGDGLDPAALAPTDKRRKTKLGQGVVHAVEKGGARLEVVVVPGEGLAGEARARLIRAQHQSGNQIALVPVERLLALPGWPALIELRLRSGTEEVRLVHETLSIGPEDVPDAAFTIPEGYTLTKSPWESLDEEMTKLSRAARAAMTTAPAAGAPAAGAPAAASSPAPGSAPEAPARPAAESVHEAASRGDVDAIRRFAASGASLTEPDAKRKMPPLQLAAEAGRADAIRALLELGAPVDGVDAWKRTPLQLAAAKGRLDAARALLDAGADASSVDWRFNTPLTRAERGGHADVAELLRSRGAKAAELDVRWAALNGDVARLEELIASGADISSVAHEGWTPMVLALRGEHDEAAELLLASGARTDVKMKGDWTVLHAAAAEGRRPFFEALLRMGVPKDLRVEGAQTSALHVAAWNAPPDFVAWLIDAHGLKPSWTLANGETPLHGAASRGRLETVKVLLERGADRAAKDRAGRTPADRAEAEGHDAIAALLRAN